MYARNMSARFSRLVDVCKKRPTSDYEKMDNNRLAVYAIGKLEENNIPRTHEAITVALFLMFPEKFSLVGFPQYPDTERTNRTLLQLGEKYRNWATGNRHTGYVLNEAGRFVLKQTIELLKRPELQTGKIKAPRTPRTRDPNAEMSEIEKSHLYQTYIESKLDESNEYDFWELMHAFPYTSKKALKNRFKEMQEISKQASREDILTFLTLVKEKYSKLFKEK